MVLTKRLVFNLIIILCLLFCCLPSATLFVSSAFNAYYALLFSSIILYVWMTVTCLKKRIFPRIGLYSLSFSLFVAYVFIHSNFIHCERYYVTGLLAAYILTIACGFFSHEQYCRDDIYLIVSILSIIQCLYAWMQLFGIASPNSIDFIVSGSFDNPNITAIILAMTMPLIKNLKWHKTIRIIVFFLLISTLFLLKCRTAFLITMGWIVVEMGFNETFRKRIKQCRHTTIKIATLCLAAMILSFSIFKFKEESSLGRWFIIRQSINLASQNPILGIGYGMFEKEFNLFQAEQLQTENCSDNEKKHASWVFTAYNEFLEQYVQGGITGLLFFSLWIICCFLISIRSKNKITLCVTLSVFITMLTNFWFQAYPILLFSVLITSISNLETENRYKYRKYLLSFVILCSLISIVLVGKHAIFTVYAQNRLKYYSSVKEKNMDLTIKIGNLKPYISTSSNFYYYYGVHLYKNKKFENSLQVLEEGSNFTSIPGIYIGLFYNYNLYGNKSKAQMCYDYLKSLNFSTDGQRQQSEN